MVKLSKARDCGQSLAGAAVSNPARGMDVCVVSKDKKPKCRTIKTKETSTDVVQSVREYKKNPDGVGIFL